MHPHQQTQTLEALLEAIQDLKKTSQTPTPELRLSDEMPLRSENQKDLFSALAKAQADMPIAVRSSINPYFKSNYASFSDIIKASRTVLSKNGLAVSQDIIERDNGQKYLYTVLMHASGQFKASRIKINPVKQDIQELGKYVSYLKRYTYAALVGVADAMEDDDGESSMVEVREERAQKSPHKKIHKPVPLPSEETITREQLSLLDEELEDYPDIVDLVLDGFKIQTLADMPKQQYSFTLKRIRQIKEARSKGEKNDIPHTGTPKK
jgi:hypothetical protein